MCVFLGTPAPRVGLVLPTVPAPRICFFIGTAFLAMMDYNDTIQVCSLPHPIA